MKRLPLILLASVPLYAESPVAKQPRVVQDRVMEGTVVSVNPAFDKVVIKDNTGNLTEFSISMNTPVTGAYAQQNYRSLHPGDRIAVRYTAQYIQRVERR